MLDLLGNITDNIFIDQGNNNNNREGRNLANVRWNSETRETLLICRQVRNPKRENDFRGIFSRENLKSRLVVFSNSQLHKARMRAREIEQMQDFPPPHFFSSINFEGYPLPDFQRTLSPQRLCAVQCRNEIESVRQIRSAVTKRSLSVRQCQNEVPD